MTPPTAHMRLWSCVLTLANSSVITAPLYHSPLSPPRGPPCRPSSLGPEPTLPDAWAAARWAGWVGHLGARGSLNLPLPALLVTRLHPRVQLRAWLGQGDPQGAIDTRSGQGEGLGPLLLFLHPFPPPPHSSLTGPQAEVVCSPGWCRWGPEEAHHPDEGVLGHLLSSGALWELRDFTHFIAEQWSQVKLAQLPVTKAGSVPGGQNHCSSASLSPRRTESARPPSPFPPGCNC